MIVVSISDSGLPGVYRWRMQFTLCLQICLTSLSTSTAILRALRADLGQDYIFIDKVPLL